VLVSLLPAELAGEGSKLLKWWLESFLRVDSDENRLSFPRVEIGMGHDSIASTQSFVGRNTALFATRARVLRLPSSSSS